MATERFQYGFNVHSISKVNSPQQSPKKKTQTNKKNSRNTKNRQQQNNKKPKQTAVSPPCVELYTSSCSRLLDASHLNAASATSFHDLQCGTATFALQAFLEYPNLRRVFGIEQNKNLFHWASKNLLSLIKNGYGGKKFLMVEQIPSTKMTIAQKLSPSSLESLSFNVGDIVFAFIALKQNNITKKDNYQGIIKSVHKDGIHYDVEMSLTKKIAKNVHKETIFKAGTERTFEIVRGNLFERSDSFRADMVCLPYSISNDSFKSLLLTGCKRSPIGSRILSYSHLELWDGFPSYSHTLRRIDANIYDSDRYESSLSSYIKLYCYSHTLSTELASSPKVISHSICTNADILVRDQQQQIWYPAVVLSVSSKLRTVRVNKKRFILNTGIEDIRIDDQRIHLISRRFKIGELVNAYCPKMISVDHAEKYTLYRSQIIAYNDDGTYNVQYEDGETHPKVYDYQIFKLQINKYKCGDILYARRYDSISLPEQSGKDDDKEQEEEEEEPYSGQLLQFRNTRNIKVDKNKCVVRHINPSGSYRVEFYDLHSKRYHDSFCECWLDRKKSILASTIDNKEDEEQDYILPICLEIDYSRITLWRCNMVSYWFTKCGIPGKYSRIFIQHNINGIFLFDLDLDLIINDMQIPKTIASNIIEYIRALKHEVQYTSSEDEEKLQLIRQEILKYKSLADQTRNSQNNLKIKLNQFIKENQNGEEYKKYEEYLLKIKCQTMGNRGKISKKDISNQLKKPQSWVKKILKLKINSIKKPNGNIIKECEKLKLMIGKHNKEINEINTKLQQSKEQMRRFGE